VEVQQASDTVRVVGNNAVHPGVLDLKDNLGVAEAIFRLVNIIVDRMITQPKTVQAVYNKLVPASQRKVIQRRDAKP
jgi:hypothetical protein